MIETTTVATPPLLEEEHEKKLVSQLVWSSVFITLKAEVANQTGLAQAVRAINCLGTPQVRKDTRSLIDMKALGRPKGFTGKEEGVQQWSEKIEAFFAGV